jgi:hypothetical protein
MITDLDLAKVLKALYDPKPVRGLTSKKSLKKKAEDPIRRLVYKSNPFLSLISSTNSFSGQYMPIVYSR